MRLRQRPPHDGPAGEAAEREERRGGEPLPVWRAALLSRLAVCALVALSDLLVPDWQDGDATVAHFACPWPLRGFARWDGARFLGVAQEGYTDERTHAFFPGLPLLIRAAGSAGGGSPAALASAGLLAANGCFVASAVALHRLTRRTLGERLARRTALVYCATPASVFHSCVYTESPFALATFGGLLLLHDGHRAPAACAFAAGTCLRSNGVANAGYLLFDALCRSARRRRLPPLLAGAALACLVAAPAILHELRAYARYCTGGGDQLTGLPVWCNRTVPSLYGHVQREHWKNGFLAYWELKQLPNFALAAPAVSVLLGGAVSYARAVHAAGWRAFISDGGMGSVAVLPHVVKDVFLAILAVFFMNVQVATRFFSAASPSFHWWLAMASLDPDWAGAVKVYLASFVFLGILLHPNCLPWT